MFADKVQGRPGRGGNVFEFYDCGLASILEALDKRTAPAPQP